MSTAPPEIQLPLIQFVTRIDRFAAACHHLVVSGVRAIAFWGAIVLPFPTLAVLYGGVGDQQAGFFLGLLVVNVVCLVIGHEHPVNS